jgi:hypothetical protein
VVEAAAVPVAPLAGLAEGHDDDVEGPLGDLLVAARAAVGLECRVRLDRSYLGHPTRYRVLHVPARAASRA